MRVIAASARRSSAVKSRGRLTTPRRVRNAASFHSASGASSGSGDFSAFTQETMAGASRRFKQAPRPFPRPYLGRRLAVKRGATRYGMEAAGSNPRKSSIVASGGLRSIAGRSDRRHLSRTPRSGLVKARLRVCRARPVPASASPLAHSGQRSARASSVDPFGAALNLSATAEAPPSAPPRPWRQAARRPLALWQHASRSCARRLRRAPTCD